MTDEDHQPLVPVPPGSLTQTTGGPHGVLARMSSDVSAIVRAKDRELKQARFRIGEYEFREPDYRQILRWADTSDWTPEGVVEGLARTRFERKRPNITVEFSVVDGCISSLFWKFPLDTFAWEDGLSIHTLGFESYPPSGRLTATLLPASLQTLVCESISLEELDLSGVPGLTRLCCGQNQLTEINLSGVPKLTFLDCRENQLPELNLSGVPELTALACSHNRLTELDLSGVPKLTVLVCSDNLLTELDLSGVPGLTRLACRENQLPELNLSGVPELTALACSHNLLTELDIRPIKKLHSLWVDANVRIIGSPAEGCEIVRV